MTLLLCIGLFFSANSRAYLIEEEATEKEPINRFITRAPVPINDECNARNFSQRIWYSSNHFPSYYRYESYIFHS